MRWGRASWGMLLVALAMIVPHPASQAQTALPCSGMDKRLDTLIDLYITEAGHQMGKTAPPLALERARRAAIAGDARATITVTGIGLMLRGTLDRITLSTLRQVCGFAEKTKHPLHLVTCAYFNALNPIGNRELKFAAVRKNLSEFQALPADTRDLSEELRAHAEALDACLRVVPPARTI